MLSKFVLPAVLAWMAMPISGDGPETLYLICALPSTNLSAYSRSNCCTSTTGEPRCRVVVFPRDRDSAPFKKRCVVCASTKRFNHRTHNEGRGDRTRKLVSTWSGIAGHVLDEKRILRAPFRGPPLFLGQSSLRRRTAHKKNGPHRQHPGQTSENKVYGYLYIGLAGCVVAPREHRTLSPKRCRCSSYTNVQMFTTFSPFLASWYKPLR
jgi:hypothetical protein